MTVRIALDVFGGDRAPEEVMKGAIQAQADFPDIKIIYVGKSDQIKDHYERLGGEGSPEIAHASEVVAMEDSPLTALKEKKDNSITKGLALHKNQEAHAFVSAGNTGACVAAATLQLRMLQGIQRPGIACSFPSEKGFCLLLDCGANVNARPRHLLEYAILGSAFESYVADYQDARVGLLNIGEESSKGNDLVKESYELLKNSDNPFNFVGNVEAKDLFNNSVDVVVCEGFVGNSLLKAVEGVSSLFFKSLKDVITETFVSRLGGSLLQTGLRRIKKKGDPNEFGGAPLLGVNGNVIIAHGSSSAWGIRNAIRTAKEMVKNDLNANIQGLL